MTRSDMTFEEDVLDRLARIETSSVAVQDHEIRIRVVEGEVITRLTRIEANAALITDHEVRLRAMEKRSNYQMGAASVLGVIGGGAASFLLSHLKAMFQ